MPTSSSYSHGLNERDMYDMDTVAGKRIKTKRPTSCLYSRHLDSPNGVVFNYISLYGIAIRITDARLSNFLHCFYYKHSNLICDITLTGWIH